MNHSKILFAFILAASTNACLAGSGLRIVCDGDANGAEVLIDGKFKGECPLDLQVPEGTLQLRVQKSVDAQHDPRVFEQDIRIGDGVMKKVEVHFGALELNAEGKRRQQEQAEQAAVRALSSIETDMVAIPGKNYELGKYEVTQGQWKAIMGSNPSNFQKCSDNSSTCGDQNPVEYVSWDDIQIFLQKLNSKTGRQYRLPNEAEWEYACYGGSKSEYCGGNDLDAVGWYKENSGGVTHRVGQKRANGYGLYDMTGNVWEWMQNEYNGGRALRGGSCFNLTDYARAAFRFRSSPADRGSDFGFRVARTLP